MSDSIQTKLEQSLERITRAVADGLDLEDLPVLVEESMRVAEQLDDVPGEQKGEFAKSFALALFDKFFASGSPRLNELIEAIDVPLLPEAVERVTIDPILKAWAPSLLRSALAELLPRLFTLVADASHGRVINVGEE